MKTWTTEEILEMLTRQLFADFYADDGLFGRWLMGDEDSPTKEQVIKQLEKLLEVRGLSTGKIKIGLEDGNEFC